MLAAMLAQIERIDTPSVDWGALAPLLVLMVGAALMLLVDGLVTAKVPPGLYAGVTVALALGSMGAAVPLWREVQDADRGPFGVLAGAIGIDGFSVFFIFVIGAAVILSALLADGYLRREGLEGVELYVLILLSASGGLIMAAANDLIVTFLGLEILSIAVYVLSAMHRRRRGRQEAALKYFVLGAFSSAFFLYGIALVYGATGTTRLDGIAAYVGPAGSGGATFSGDVSPSQILGGAAGTPALLLAGLALLLVGFGFKVAAVPFHSWTPDVYQGSPSPVVAFMASGVKAAGFAGLLRVFLEAFGGYRDDWRPFVYVLAVATLVVGAVLAAVQTDVKRMLAYSSINHAGFVLLGVQAASDRGTSAALFYLAAYTFMVAGSFGIVTLVSRRGDGATTVEDFRGLARRQPAVALTFTLFLLAQAGVPLTSGFFAKFEVLQAAVDADAAWLAVVAMVTAVIAAFLYLRIIGAMYLGDAPAEGEADGRADLDRGRVPLGAGIALVIAAAFTLVVGLFPEPLAQSADDATPDAVATGRDPAAGGEPVAAP
jgi:NADH-quinone oxidoreductase subunit N